jgi:hypothetical protein
MRHALIGASIFGCVVLGASAAALRTPSARQFTEISQPAEWVAFDADVLVETPNVVARLAGHFYRNAERSERLETWRADNPSVKAISIHNIPKSRMYGYWPGKEQWVSAPMVLPPNGMQPPRWRAEMKNLSLRSEPLDGFEVYQTIGVAGDVQRVAPALNFFALYQRHARTGEVKTYSNVQIRPQDPTLFELPEGVNPAELTTPHGIVWGGRADPAAGRPNGTPAAATPGSCCGVGAKPRQEK